MARARDPILTQFSQRLAIETPEHVVVELELAGLGSRLAAVLVDAILLGILEWVLGEVLGAVGGAGSAAGGWVLAVGISLAFLFFWGYFLLFEALNNGRTPGKMLLGIRVVLETGHRLTFAAAAVRNLVRIVDATFLFVIGLLFVLLHPQNKRLGDIVAGTIVVRERPTEVSLGRQPPGPQPAAELLEPGIPELRDDELRLLSQVLDRLDILEPAARDRFVSALVTRFAPRFPARDPDPLVFLSHLYGDELAKRRGRVATRAGGATGAAATGERFVARKREVWERFRQDAAHVERFGLRRLDSPELLAFAARYREVAADLARARTYQVSPQVIEYLERVVGAGHNAVYGLRGVRRGRLGVVLLRELPAAVVAARGYVLVAFLLFAVPAATGFAVIRERPDAAWEVLPAEMISRAEEGQRRQTAGVGYAETPSPFLPIMASQIIANNVQVAFGAFALGITAGVGTAIVLIFNGLFFGAVVGLFANYGLTRFLLTFVLGHGVLELSAIFIAGGAGLLVGRALIAPGDLTRHDALIVNGRRAIRLVGAATCLLVVAGTIEGFLSASDAAPGWKFAVSAASAVLLVLYLTNGWRVGKAATTTGAASGSAATAPTPGAAAAIAPGSTSASST